MILRDPNSCVTLLSQNLYPQAEVCFMKLSRKSPLSVSTCLQASILISLCSFLTYTLRLPHFCENGVSPLFAEAYVFSGSFSHSTITVSHKAQAPLYKGF
jgi:hypothetical protein